MILDTLTDDSTVVSDEMSDENKDGAESEKSDDVDDAELTSSISATTISSAGIKRSKKIEMIDDLVSKVVKMVSEGLKESDKMFLELEEKRMKFDE